MNVRIPFRAGSFYASSPTGCREEAERLLRNAAPPSDLPDALYGGLVPHAGWAYSGSIAAQTLRALREAGAPETFVLLGADHTGTARQGEVYPSGAWKTPLGEAPVDEELAQDLLDAGRILRPNPDAHTMEHSIEVQIPLVQVAAESPKIVPIMVPPTRLAVEIGKLIGQALKERGGSTTIVGSTDLTHHGGHFGSPGGTGPVGEKWSRENDRRMLGFIEAMDAEAVVPEADSHGNACGAGAIAATISACRELGATRGICLEYTNSYEIIHAQQPDFPDDTTVGYASVVFA